MAEICVVLLQIVKFFFCSCYLVHLFIFFTFLLICKVQSGIKSSYLVHLYLDSNRTDANVGTFHSCQCVGSCWTLVMVGVVISGNQTAASLYFDESETRNL